MYESFSIKFIIIKVQDKSLFFVAFGFQNDEQDR